ncbi:MAG: hypothetical protein AzoDbin1_03753 [Azoarcus sp.]|nr:hypothetical protein [Aromatoleum toluolicum]MCK9987281.1 hypothetical protein [Azoarcus sp.]MCQ6964016.1 hypothetical protein [Aromatoleum toluolicum]
MKAGGHRELHGEELEVMQARLDDAPDSWRIVCRYFTASATTGP